jgi:hypothetical protein
LIDASAQHLVCKPIRCLDVGERHLDELDLPFTLADATDFALVLMQERDGVEGAACGLTGLCWAAC